MRLADLATQIDATAIGEMHVQDRHIRQSRGDDLSCIVNRCCFTDDAEIRLRLEEIRDPAPHHLMIVYENDPEHVVLRSPHTDG
ncbi:hypothetical protein GCM10009588_22280 [Microbacterium phyllosphaerae]